jgi:tRNA A-37 threonylcarbamoyl transferase component Bud32
MDRIGRYRIIGELGRGAMGVVYHATDPAIGRSVAIKIIRISDINDTRNRDKLRDRLFREARSAGVLSHPNIVTIYDMDEIEGVAYIAMAYVNGPTLEKVLSTEGAISGSRMLRVLRQTASALDYAHGRGIVHRDVKPANIMTDEDGVVKITDFGIAKITAGANMTDTRTVVGTPNYMSPEQVQGLTVDGRSDQFSLAVIAYEILTGERPFEGEQLSTVVYRIVNEEPVPAHQVNGTLTSKIDSVLARALSKEPEKRFANCSAFVGALEMACAESRGWTTLAPGSAAAMPTLAVEPEPSPVAGTEPVFTAITAAAAAPAGRRSLFWPVTLGLLVLLGIAGALAWEAGGFGSNPTPAPIVAAEEKSPPDPVPEKQPPAAVETAPEQVAKATPFPETSPAAVPLVEKPVAGSSRQQDLWIVTNPPGAKVILDSDLNQPCQAPCIVHAAPGVHHLTVSQAGYMNEYREIKVGDTAPDIPVINMRQPGGTLMLTSTPSGASIKINGQSVPDLTPATLQLKPGRYSVTVEKDGKSQTQSVDVEQNLVYMRIPLTQ